MAVEWDENGKIVTQSAAPTEWDEHGSPISASGGRGGRGASTPPSKPKLGFADSFIGGLKTFRPPLSQPEESESSALKRIKASPLGYAVDQVPFAGILKSDAEAKKAGIPFDARAGKMIGETVAGIAGMPPIPMGAAHPLIYDSRNNPPMPVPGFGPQRQLPPPPPPPIRMPGDVAPDASGPIPMTATPGGMRVGFGKQRQLPAASSHQMPEAGTADRLARQQSPPEPPPDIVDAQRAAPPIPESPKQATPQTPQQAKFHENMAAKKQRQVFNQTLEGYKGAAAREPREPKPPAMKGGPTVPVEPIPVAESIKNIKSFIDNPEGPKLVPNQPEASGPRDTGMAANMRKRDTANGVEKGTRPSELGPHDSVDYHETNAINKINNVVDFLKQNKFTREQLGKMTQAEAQLVYDHALEHGRKVGNPTPKTKYDPPVMDGSTWLKIKAAFDPSHDPAGIAGHLK